MARDTVDGRRDQRIAAALERIATALEALAERPAHQGSIRPGELIPCARCGHPITGMMASAGDATGWVHHDEETCHFLRKGG